VFISAKQKKGKNGEREDLREKPPNKVFGKSLMFQQKRKGELTVRAGRL